MARQCRVDNDQIRAQLLETAHHEFLAYGYSGASLRRICHQVGVVVSTIYRFWRDKDDLYGEVLRPVLNVLEEFMRARAQGEEVRVYIDTPDRYIRERAEWLSKVVTQYRGELRLLLQRSAGSSLEHYPQMFEMRQQAVNRMFVARLRELLPNAQQWPSEFFFRAISAGWVRILDLLVTSDNVEEEEVRRLLQEYSTFYTAGWKALLQP